MENNNGRGMGLGRGRGSNGMRNQRNGKGNASRQNSQMGGVAECVCPNCKFTQPHQRGIPCIQVKCPKCDTLMQGDFCKE